MHVFILKINKICTPQLMLLHMHNKPIYAFFNACISGAGLSKIERQGGTLHLALKLTPPPNSPDSILFPPRTHRIIQMLAFRIRDIFVLNRGGCAGSTPCDPTLTTATLESPGQQQRSHSLRVSLALLPPERPTLTSYQQNQTWSG